MCLVSLDMASTELWKLEWMICSMSCAIPTMPWRMDLVVSRKTPSCVCSVSYIAAPKQVSHCPMSCFLMRNVLFSINDNCRESRTLRLSRESRRGEMLVESMRAVMLLSGVDMGRPRDDEKCRSIMYSVHHRLRHLTTVSTPSSSSGSCVCRPSSCAIRIA